MPTLQRSFQGKTQILVGSSILKLKRGSLNNTSLSPFLKRMEGEKMAKQSKMGFDAKEGFAEVDKCGNVKN